MGSKGVEVGVDVCQVLESTEFLDEEPASEQLQRALKCLCRIIGRGQDSVADGDGDAVSVGELQAKSLLQLRVFLQEINDMRDL